MLEAYSYQDKKFRESMGLTPKALESGYTEATKALEKYGWGGERNAPAYNKIKTYALAAFLNQNQDIPFKYAMAALSAALILGKHTNDDSIMSSMSEYFGSAIITDKNTLTQTLEKSGITEAKYLSSIYRILGDKNIDYWLMTNTGGIMTYPSEEELKSNFNLHKTGLDFVPYDEYPALLHEGEAVLTKDAASYLRTATPEDISQLGGVQDALDNTTQVTSVSDYTPIVTVLQESDRSNKESLNLVASAINNQTNVMVSKLDKIITVISSNKGSSTYSNNFVNLESGGF